MTPVGSTATVHILKQGSVSPEATEYAVEKLDAALHHAPGPVIGSWLTLSTAAPGVRVDANVHVGGAHLHVHAVGETLQEATDLMQQRLRSRLRRIRRRPDQGPQAPAPIGNPFLDPSRPATAVDDRRLAV
jgi:ribosome-associated translation inhibitor RaiA